MVIVLPTQIANGVIFVKGPVNGAIYQTNTRKVYWLDEEYTKSLVHALSTKSYDETIIKILSDMELFDKNNIKTYIPPNPDPKIKFAWIELTSECNLSCIHCYGKFGKVKDKSNITLDTWKHIISDLKSMGCKTIEFIGGEPTIKHELIELLYYCSELDIKPIVFTNGTLINEPLVKAFKDNNTSIMISLYSSDSSTHDSVTSVEGSFARTNECIKQLVKQGIRVTTSTILMNNNQNDAQRTIDYVKNIGVQHVKVDFIRNNDLDSLEPSDIVKKKFMINKPNFDTNLSEFNINFYYNSCWYGKIAITSEGIVIPCVFSRNNTLGDIKQNSIEDILNNSYKRLLENFCLSNIVECSRCEFRYCCKDCRILTNNKQVEKKNRCLYSPYDGKWKEFDN